MKPIEITVLQEQELRLEAITLAKELAYNDSNIQPLDESLYIAIRNAIYVFIDSTHKVIK